jgi:8-oxo-dGTP pyrophosphatase MutT (NUDIX family)
VTDEPTTVATIAEGIARISWAIHVQERGFLEAVGVVTEAVERGLRDHGRVEVLVDPDDEVAQRVATWSGLHREGVLRGYHQADGGTADRVVYARLATDPPVSEPGGFRSLLNSFLPRKRAIGQVLVRDGEGRVLLCQLTYKQDWDLPGGVVEVGESPQLAAVREVEEELGLKVPPGNLLLTDWLPPWGGWDDALCLVFDGGVHDATVAVDFVLQSREIRTAEFCTPDQVRERCAGYTADRVASALANLAGGPSYTESGR